MKTRVEGLLRAFCEMIEDGVRPLADGALDPPETFVGGQRQPRAGRARPVQLVEGEGHERQGTGCATRVAQDAAHEALVEAEPRHARRAGDHLVQGGHIGCMQRERRLGLAQQRGQMRIVQAALIEIRAQGDQGAQPGRAGHSPQQDREG